MSAQSILPAEFPPASYTGLQYVDSNGCVFVRAGIAGIVNWVPRMDRHRQQLCGFQPTFAQAPEPVAVAVAAPVITVPQPTPAPVVAPVSVTPAPAPAPSVPVPASEPTPSTMTRAELCEGRFGPQPGYISSRTGQPIDCGPAPAPVAAATPADRNEPPSMTLAAACALMQETGRRFMDAATGAPIVCVAPAPVATAMPAPVAAPAPSAAPTCEGFSGTSAQYMTSASGGTVRCGPQQQLPYSYAPPVQTSAISNRLGSAVVPASNPPAGTPVSATPPEGYVAVWNDGRLNPNRGLPGQNAAAPQDQVSTRAASPAVAAAYVQVGSFGNPANADAVAAQLSALGYDVRMGRLTSGGTVLRVVLAGPFASQIDLNAALAALRAQGYSDAFVRS